MIVPLLAIQLAVVVVICVWAVDCIRTYASPVSVPWALVFLVRVAASLLLWWLAGLPPFHGLG